jgi:hypothetical protein
VAVPPEKKDYILFATNKDVKSIEEFEPKSLNCENLENIPIKNCGKCME